MWRRSRACGAAIACGSSPSAAASSATARSGSRCATATTSTTPGRTRRPADRCCTRSHRPGDGRRGPGGPRAPTTQSPRPVCRRMRPPRHTRAGASLAAGFVRQVPVSRLQQGAQGRAAQRPPAPRERCRARVPAGPCCCRQVQGAWPSRPLAAGRDESHIETSPGFRLGRTVIG